MWYVIYGVSTPYPAIIGGQHFQCGRRDYRAAEPPSWGKPPHPHRSGGIQAGDFALPRTLYLNGGLSSPHTPSRSGLCPLQPPKFCFKPYGGGVHGASGAVRRWGVGAFFLYRSNLKHFYLVIMQVKFSTLLLRGSVEPNNLTGIIDK